MYVFMTHPVLAKIKPGVSWNAMSQVNISQSKRGGSLLFTQDVFRGLGQPVKISKIGYLC